MENNNLIPKEHNYPAQLTTFEAGLVTFLGNHNLPTSGIFVSVDERLRVFNNIDYVIKLLDPQLSSKSVYLSKYLAATAAGLFDAALNYLWDETILQLRKRVAHFDIEYFYDNAVGGERRNNFRTEEDLIKLQDSELIQGAKEIELISEIGHKHLSLINYMRNWASAAHPNQNEITGLQLITWLETCIKEVISIPLPKAAVEIKKLLSNIRKSAIEASDADEIGVFLTELHQEQADTLAAALFGIYTRIETETFIRNNVKLLLPLVWGALNEDTKDGFGVKYAHFSANHQTQQKQLAKEFLEIVNGQKHIPDDLRIPEVENSLINLINAHRNMNNFYNEPPFARALLRVIGVPPKVPKKLNKQYVLSIVELFITNGNGITRDAQPIYVGCIKNFDSRQATIALLSFLYDNITNRLQFSLCQNKFKELLVFLRPQITNASTIELLDLIEKFPGRFDTLRTDSNIKRALKNLEILLK